MSGKHAEYQGFTLIELMIVVVLIAVIAAIAAPSFANMIRDNRLTTQANNLLASLQLARSEAVSRGVQVTVRRAGNNNGVWEQGWQVFTDWDADGQFDGNSNVTDCSIEQDCLIRVSGPLDANSTLRTSNNYGAWVAYLPSGQATSSGGLANDTFQLCDAKGEVADGRSLVINNTGRPTVEKGVNACP